jgi:ribosomal-protein-alanine N-acetyltransferase
MITLPRVWPLEWRVGAPRLPAFRLEGARLYLQAPQRDDWRDWRAVRERNADYLKPFEPVWPDKCLTRDFFIRRLRRQQADWRYNRARYFLIRLQDSGTLIGGINMNNIQMGAARHASLGYWLDQDHQGQGYMQEAVGLILRYGFNMLGLMRIHAACVPENVRSKNLLLRVGLREEGFAAGYLQINGAWRDHHLFGITRDDYLGVAS